MMQVPASRNDFFALGGGLDLVTPSIAVAPGKVLDSQNYEPAIGGRYRRINGYERADGRPSPTGRSYWILAVTVTTTIEVGETITGDDSSATAVVLQVRESSLVLGDLTGGFDAGEDLLVSASPVGTVEAAELLNGAAEPFDHADCLLLAANLQRAKILAVPGSGPIRGVWVYKDDVYAVRDNVGATASVIHKATPTGWSAISLGNVVQFDAATAEISVGNTISNLAGTATGTVVTAILRSGTWISAGVGTLVLSGVVGTFADNDQIRVGGVQKATANGASGPVTRLPGGRCEFCNYNFTGSADTLRVYGVDGVNPAFEFDGSTYVPILTGMPQDKPTHVIGHKNHLFLSFKGSVQHSAITNPYSWTVVLGAGEFGTGSDITGFLTQGGSAEGSSLAIMTREKPFILYGSSTDDFSLVASAFDIGFAPYTMQQVSNDAFGLTSRGIQALRATQSYGNFAFASISHAIQPLMTSLRGKEIASTTLTATNQYRVYFDNGYAVTVGLTGDKVSGLLLLNYERPVRCIVTASLSTGDEVTYFGSDDGYVYLDNVGTSQDGQPIEAWCRLPFNNVKTPMLLKRFRRASFDVVVESYAEVNISYDFGYASPEGSPSAPAPDVVLSGAGGFWDSSNFVWDRFTWDSAAVANTSMTLDGTDTNISFLFYSNRAQDSSHTLQGVTLVTTPQRLSR